MAQAPAAPALAASRVGGGRAWCAALLVTVALALSAVIPPLQSPDEAAHLVRAYVLSQGHFLLERPPAPGVGSGGYVDDGLVEYGRIYDRVTAKPGNRLTAAEIAAADALRWKATASYVSAEGTGYYLPVAYLPQALALFLGERLDLTIDHTYRLTRLLAFVASLATLAFAFRLHPANPLVAMLLVLPMTVFQLVSATLDGWTTALAVLAIALFLRGMNPRSAYPAWMAWLLAACLVVVAASRAHLLPLTVLPLFVYLVRRQNAALAGFLIAPALSLAWTLFAIQYTVVGPGRPAMSSGVVDHYVSQPLDFLHVLAATLGHGGTLDFYLKSFVGILGWLDTPLPAWTYTLTAYALAVAAALSVSVRTLRSDALARAILIGLALASCLLVFLALLLSWTPHPATLIAGVQGRYFLVPALVAAYALSGYDDTWSGMRGQVARIAVGAYGAVALYATVQALILRYYATA